MRIARFVLTAAAAVIGFPVAATSGLLFDGAEFQVNTYTTGGQPVEHGGAVARAADGRFVIVWERTGSPSVHGQRFDGTGAAAGTEFQINTIPAQGSPVVAAAPDGSFVVAWHSPADGGTGIGAQRFAADGSAVGTEFTVNSYTTYAQAYPSVSVAGDGSFVVVWDSFGQDGSFRSIHGQRYEATGAPAGTEFQVNSYTTGFQNLTAVSTAADGSFVVVWTSDAGQDGSGYSVQGQRYDSAGAAVGTEFQVNSYTTGDQGYRFDVSSRLDGGFVVVWESVGQDGSGYSVHGQRFDSSGASAGTEFQINSYTTGIQKRPAVSVAPDSSFVVVWITEIQYPVDWDTRGQRYDSAGAPLGTEFQVNSYTTGVQGYGTAIAVDATGDFVVVWDSTAPASAGQDGDFSGTFGQLLCDDADADLACDDAIADEEIDEPVSAGGTVTSDPEADGATPSDAIETAATSPNAGTVTIYETVVSTDPPVFQIDITAPAASVADPLVLEFRVDATLAASFQVLKNGVAVSSVCTGAPGTASPDPCVDSVTVLPDGDVLVTVLTSTASQWTLELAAVTCPATPATGCITGAKTSFQLKDSTDDTKDLLKWKLSKGGVFDQMALGDPVTVRMYALCVYDETAGTPSLVATIQIDPNANWVGKDPKGFGYKDKAGAEDGVTKASLRAGDAGKTAASISAKGAAIPMPAPLSMMEFFDLDTALTVQLVNDQTSLCWTSEFATATKNDGVQFKAKAP